MEITGSYGADSLLDLSGIERASDRRRYSGIAAQTTASGDSVDISDDARKLYSEMIHKYERASSRRGNSSNQETENENSQSGSAQGGSGAGAASGASSTDEVENIKKQIQALKSQLMSLASQAAQGGGASGAATAKMNSLQSQIAALEAQLNSMQTA